MSYSVLQDDSYPVTCQLCCLARVSLSVPKCASSGIKFPLKTTRRPAMAREFLLDIAMLTKHDSGEPYTTQAAVVDRIYVLVALYWHQAIWNACCLAASIDLRMARKRIRIEAAQSLFTEQPGQWHKGQTVLRCGVESFAPVLRHPLPVARSIILCAVSMLATRLRVSFLHDPQKKSARWRTAQRDARYVDLTGTYRKDSCLGRPQKCCSLLVLLLCARRDDVCASLQQRGRI